MEKSDSSYQSGLVRKMSFRIGMRRLKIQTIQEILSNNYWTNVTKRKLMLENKPPNLKVHCLKQIKDIWSLMTNNSTQLARISKRMNLQIFILKPILHRNQKYLKGNLNKKKTKFNQPLLKFFFQVS